MSEPTTTPAGPTTSSTDRGAPAVAVEDLTIRFATDGAPAHDERMDLVPRVGEAGERAPAREFEIVRVGSHGEDALGGGLSPTPSSMLSR